MIACVIASALLRGLPKSSPGPGFLLMTGGGSSWVAHGGRSQPFKSGVELRVSQADGRVLLASPNVMVWESLSGTFRPLTDQEARGVLGRVARVMNRSSGVPNFDLSEVASLVTKDGDVVGVDFVGAAGLGAKRTARLPRGDDASLSWSPNGKEVAISLLKNSSIKGSDDNPDYDLYVLT